MEAAWSKHVAHTEWWGFYEFQTRTLMGKLDEVIRVGGKNYGRVVLGINYIIPSLLRSFSLFATIGPSTFSLECHTHPSPYFGPPLSLFPTDYPSLSLSLSD